VFSVAKALAAVASGTVYSVAGLLVVEALLSGVRLALVPLVQLPGAPLALTVALAVVGLAPLTGLVLPPLRAVRRAELVLVLVLVRGDLVTGNHPEVSLVTPSPPPRPRKGMKTQVSAT